MPRSASARLSHYHMLGLLALWGLELACGTAHLSAAPSVELSSDRQVLLVRSGRQTPPARLTVRDLPTESMIAPGLFFRPQGFDHVRLSPDGRHAAFSTVDHHTLVGLLDLSTMAIQEIDVITEGEVSAFHWRGDSRMLAYDYLPASGYRRVKAYDIQAGESLFVPRDEGRAALHIRFEAWGSQRRDVVLSTLDFRTNNRQMNTVTLAPRK